MTAVISLLTALERHDVATLTDLLEHDGMTAEPFTAEEATVLWDAGWHVWLGEGEDGYASWPTGDERGEGRPEPWASDHDAGPRRGVSRAHRSGTSPSACFYGCSMPLSLHSQAHPPG